MENIQTSCECTLVDRNFLPAGETILLVEDEPFVRKVAAQILQSAGYNLLAARSGSEALESFGPHAAEVDLLLADVVLPGMSGIDLAMRFETLSPRVRTILMSGHEECLAGCAATRTCLAKPFAAHTLLQNVREALSAQPRDVTLRH